MMPDFKVFDKDGFMLTNMSARSYYSACVQGWKPTREAYADDIGRMWVKYEPWEDLAHKTKYDAATDMMQRD